MRHLSIPIYLLNAFYKHLKISLLTFKHKNIAKDLPLKTFLIDLLQVEKVAEPVGETPEKTAEALLLFCQVSKMDKVVKMDKMVKMVNDHWSC